MQNVTFYFNDSFLSVINPGAKLIGSIRMNEGECLVIPPAESTVPYLDEACPEERNGHLYPFVFAQRATMNYFSAKQLSSIARNHGMDLIESGYLQADDHYLERMPHEEDDIPTCHSTAYIIAQKPNI